MAETKKKYAQGKNPNSRKGDKNLVDIRTKTPEEQREFHVMGGKARGADIKNSIIIKDILTKLVSANIKDEDTGEEGNSLEIGLAKAVARFRKKGDVKDLEAIAEHLGQKPAQKVEQVVITPEVDFDKLESLRKALRKDD